MDRGVVDKVNLARCVLRKQRFLPRVSLLLQTCAIAPTLYPSSNCRKERYQQYLREVLLRVRTGNLFWFVGNSQAGHSRSNSYFVAKHKASRDLSQLFSYLRSICVKSSRSFPEEKPAKLIDLRWQKIRGLQSVIRKAYLNRTTLQCGAFWSTVRRGRGEACLAALD